MMLVLTPNLGGVWGQAPLKIGTGRWGRGRIRRALGGCEHNPTRLALIS